MSRPDLDWFERRLAGREGHAIRDIMHYTRVHILIDYVKELEKQNGNQGMHEVRDRKDAR